MGSNPTLSASLLPLKIFDSDGNDTGRKDCEGIATRCLESNYYEYEKASSTRGELISREVKFTLIETRRGEYRVTFFHPPESCD